MRDDLAAVRAVRLERLREVDERLEKMPLGEKMLGGDGNLLALRNLLRDEIGAIDGTNCRCGHPSEDHRALDRACTRCVFCDRFMEWRP